MTVLENLPFVDGTPTIGQERLAWLYDGEHINGVTKKFDNDGSINRVGVQLQKNIVSVATAVDSVSDIANQSVKDIEKLKEGLEEVGTSGIIEQINKNTQGIADLVEKTELTDTVVVQLDRNVETLQQQVGTSGSIPISDSIVHLKTTVGNYAGVDIDGRPAPEIPASGLIHRVDTINTQTIANRDVIKELKDEVDAADLSNMHIESSKVRHELGVSPAEGTPTVYQRIGALEGSTKASSEDIIEIKAAIGPGVISDKVDANTEAINTINTKLSGPSGVINDIIELEQRADEFDTSIEATNQKLTTLETVVTQDGSGLVPQMTEVRTTIGIDSVTPTSVIGRLNEHDTTIETNTSAIQDIQVQLGNSTTGLIGDVARHEKQLVGDAAATDPVEKTGVIASTKDLRNQLVSTNLAVNSLIDRYTYKGKTFATLSDATFTDMHEYVAQKLNATAITSVKSSGGIKDIMANNDFASAKTADVILINVGPWDFGMDTILGAIEDVDTSFYGEVRRLLDTLITSTSTNRVFISTGFKSTKFYDHNRYPGADANGKKYEEFVEAIKLVAAEFSVPVIDSFAESGIIPKNGAAYLNDTGFTAAGLKRYADYVSGSINSK